MVDVVSSTYSTGVSAYQRTAATDASLGTKVGLGTDSSSSSSYSNTIAKDGGASFGPATIDNTYGTNSPDKTYGANTADKSYSAKDTEKTYGQKDGEKTYGAKDSEKTSAADNAEKVSVYDKVFAAQAEKKGRFVQDEVKLSQQAQDVLTAQEKFQDQIQQRVDIASASLGETQFVGVDLTGTDFAGSNLATANLSFSTFTDANFSGANLQGTNFLNADVTGVSFDGADLRGADLSGVTGLTSEQLYQSKYDSSTKLPFNLTA